jgi:hypothetical protein
VNQKNNNSPVPPLHKFLLQLLCIPLFCYLALIYHLFTLQLPIFTFFVFPSFMSGRSLFVFIFSFVRLYCAEGSSQLVIIYEFPGPSWP